MHIGSQEWRDIDCPYCGESIEIGIDTSVEDQSYIEDCQVCCRPITIIVSVTPSLDNEADQAADINVWARSEND